MSRYISPRRIFSGLSCRITWTWSRQNSLASPVSSTADWSFWEGGNCPGRGHSTGWYWKFSTSCTSCSLSAFALIVLLSLCSVQFQEKLPVGWSPWWRTVHWITFEHFTLLPESTVKSQWPFWGSSRGLWVCFFIKIKGKNAGRRVTFLLEKCNYKHCLWRTWWTSCKKAVILF